MSDMAAERIRAAAEFIGGIAALVVVLCASIIAADGIAAATAPDPKHGSASDGGLVRLSAHTVGTAWTVGLAALVVLVACIAVAVGTPHDTDTRDDEREDESRTPTSR